MSLSQILKERSESKSQKSNALCRLTSNLALISFGEKWFAGSRKRRRNLIQTTSPFEDIEKYIHYGSTYPLKDQVLLTSPDVLSHTNDDKIFLQECDLIDSALINVEPDKAIGNQIYKEKQ